MITLVVAVAVLALLTAWVTWTATRVDRLHTRTEAARAALDAQLVRRSAAVQALAGSELVDTAAGIRLRAAVRAALDADDAGREAAENDLGRVLRDLPPGLPADQLHDLDEASTRVLLARRFYNDAVRDTRSLRGRRLPRLFRLGAGRPLPGFFEIDEAELATRAEPAAAPRPAAAAPAPSPSAPPRS